MIKMVIWLVFEACVRDYMFFYVVLFSCMFFPWKVVSHSFTLIGEIKIISRAIKSIRT